jgi:DNA mismatch repair protein MutS2
VAEARGEARKALAEIRQEIEVLHAEMAAKRRGAAVTDDWIAQAKQRISDKERAAAPPPLPPPAPIEEIVPPGELAVGDLVWVAGLGTTGQLVGLEEDSAEVQVGSFYVRVQRSELEWRGRPEAAKREATSALRGLHPSPGLELDLRGQRVEEIRPRLDKYLDDAFLAALPFVRIVHGKGTGALRQAVREQLRSHPLVQSYRLGEDSEGGSGVTVVFLAAGD